MTTSQATASYADVLHRLSLGEVVRGVEVLALPGLPQMRPIEPSDEFVIGDLPELIAFVTTVASLLEDENGQDALTIACDINELLASDALREQPLPDPVRGLLWNIAARVDLASKLSEV